jgi:pimeloyl-ACP methyl ester carboxylesterase
VLGWRIVTGTPDAATLDPDIDPQRFPVHRAALSTGAEIAYLREGAGGRPLLLLHGYPETMRIWWRNVAPLAAAGFDVIVPDLRGFGLSGLAPDARYDPPAFAGDLHALLTEELGLACCDVAGGDLGGVVAMDLALRFAGLVERLLLFNTVPPQLRDAYRAAGIPDDAPREQRPSADYFVRQGTDPEGLIAELDTAERRARYVAGFYGHRLWGAPGAFSAAAVDFMVEPFRDAVKLRHSWGIYEFACGRRPVVEIPRLFEPVPLPALVLYGPEDHVVPAGFCDRMAIALPHCVGPFVVPGAGHFLQWERAELFNRTAIAFLQLR